jgi:hypothetical protein
MTRVRDSVIGTASHYWPEGPRFQHQWWQDRPWAALRHLQNGYWRSLPGINRPEPGADPTSPSSTEVKNEWSYTCTLSTLPSWHVIWRPFKGHEAPNSAVFPSGPIHNSSKSKYNSLCPLCSLLSTANEYQDIPGGKDGPCVGLTTLPP